MLNEFYSSQSVKNNPKQGQCHITSCTMGKSVNFSISLFRVTKTTVYVSVASKFTKDGILRLNLVNKPTTRRLCSKR
ncbi:hypothetical protein HanRHA438_Chr11g0521881 [Helianthus annuus]|nr:hypothetical protein HanRHA438_Chr11g0521881 [Helianthus annuus]